jgi:hypothetical protein
MMQVIANQPLTLPFLSSNLVTGLSQSLINPTFLINGVPTSAPTWSLTEVGGGLYSLTFTPSVVGWWSIFVQSQLINFQVVLRDFYTMLRNIEDESVGSWQWDKVAGTLVMVRQDGTTLGTFSVVDNANSASRERIS